VPDESEQPRADQPVDAAPAGDLDRGELVAFRQRLYEIVEDVARREARKNKGNRTLARPTELANYAWMKLAEDRTARDARDLKRYVAWKLPRLVIDYYRGSESHNRQRDKGNLANADGVVAAALSADQATPDVEAQLLEREARIAETIEALEKQDELTARVFRLRYWGDLKYEEIAEETGATVDVVAKRLGAAKRFLKERLDDEGRP
jgi:RNA polymerase sigma factor (sigma-70 family)